MWLYTYVLPKCGTSCLSRFLSISRRFACSSLFCITKGKPLQLQRNNETICILRVYYSMYHYYNIIICRYLYAHIWACPPSEGDDYIFHCHPVEQKTPKPKRLQEWYKAMLEKAIERTAVANYTVSVNSSRVFSLG